ncbi:MAG TPA: UdgX family uracil-DNA binding protein [Caldimonas sp.]
MQQPDAPHVPDAADMASTARNTVRLANAVDLAGFRRACRKLWAEQIEPDGVDWHTADGAEANRLDAGAAPDRPAPGSAPPLHVPASFMPLCEHVILHSDSDRFDLLYRLLWRLQIEPDLRDNLLDADRVRAQQMAEAVRRELNEAAASGAAPRSLPVLRAALERCRECPIAEHATRAVPGEGPQRARLMFVGEQPGDQEDLQGRPFVGPAGQLFARALAELGIDRRDAYVSNAVKHFKFELRGKRRIHKTPAQEEAAACLHWLETEIALVDPQALVALGATAARQLMGAPIAVTRQRGQWLTRADGRRVLITLHPSALLRMEPEDKDAAYAAWLADLRRAAS